jgi:hypothetical protein
VPFDAAGWVRATADKRGYVSVDGRQYCAGPYWHGRRMVVGVRASSVTVLDERGRVAARLPREFGDGPAVRNPASPMPALVARPRAFGESTTGRDMPRSLVDAIDGMGTADRRRTLRAIGRAQEASGFEAACEAAARVCASGRVPDDASVDLLARRAACGAPAAGGGPDLSAYDRLCGAVA